MRRHSAAIRIFLTSLHKTYLPNVEAMREAGENTGLSLSAVHQAVINGKGSAITHGLLLCHGLKIHPTGLTNLLPNFRQLFAGGEKKSQLEDILKRVLSVYTVDEMILVLDMMLARDKMERNLGIKKKSGRPKGQTKTPVKNQKKVFSSP